MKQTPDVQDMGVSVHVLHRNLQKRASSILTVLFWQPGGFNPKCQPRFPRRDKETDQINQKKKVHCFTPILGKTTMIRI